MQLILNTFGSTLRKKDNNFLVLAEEKKVEISPKKVSSILISTAANMSTDAIYLAIENNIEIVLLDTFGHPYARIWHCKPGSTNKIRRLQLFLDRHELGLQLAKEWLHGKIEGRISFLKQLKKRRNEMEEAFSKVIESMEENLERIDAIQGNTRDRRGEIMGFEGMSGRAYFDILSSIMPSGFHFNGRSKRPAKDPFNAMLNYAYGVLYSKVENACVIAGLDPYIGILHTDNYNKLSLVFDMIEKYRPWAEEVVTLLFTGRKMQQELFRETKNGIVLEKKAKELLISSLNEMFEEAERHKGKNMKRLNIIQAECHRTANRILKEVNIDVGVGDLRYCEEQEQEQDCYYLQTDGAISGTEIGLSGDDGEQ